MIGSVTFSKNKAHFEVEVSDTISNKIAQYCSKIEILEREISQVNADKVYYKDKFEQVNMLVSKDQEARKQSERDLEAVRVESNLNRNKISFLEEERDKYKFLAFELKSILRHKNNEL